MSDAIDNALLTAEYLGRPAVATAVAAYLAAVDDRSVALGEHLSAMASALAQSALGYADTDDQIHSALDVHTADDHLSDDHPLRRPA